VAEVKEAFDTIKTNKRISQELPNCNWLEDKIKDLELTKRAEECRRLIEEELSSRRTISSLSEKQESANQPNQRACTLPVSGIIGNDELNQQPEHFLKETPVTKFAENLETARQAPQSSPEKSVLTEESQKQNETLKSIQKIQEDLMQEKKTLLKDIRIIQKRKIKEMEELIDIKLKKESYEQELEKTRLEIKKMDEYFESIRKRKSVDPEEPETAPKRPNDLSSPKTDSDIKIIDIKSSKEDKVGRAKENRASVDNKTFRTEDMNGSDSNYMQDQITSFKSSENENIVAPVGDVQSIPPTVQNFKKNHEKMRIDTLKDQTSPDLQEQHVVQQMPSLSNTSESLQQLQVDHRTLPSLQQLNYKEHKSSFEKVHRRTPINENTQQAFQHNDPSMNSPTADNFPRERDPNDLSRISQERKQYYSQHMQGFGKQRGQESFIPYPPPAQPFREYKDAILIPVNKHIARKDPGLTGKHFMREMQEQNYDKHNYQRSVQLTSPPPYQPVNNFINQHEAMMNQCYQENIQVPLRPVPQRSAQMSRIQYLHPSQQNLLPFHEQQAAHLHHLNMQKRREIERYIPQIAQDIKRPSIPMQQQQQQQQRKSIPPEEKCEACGKEANFMCSACKGAHYCSTTCQKERWVDHCKNCLKF